MSRRHPHSRIWRTTILNTSNGYVSRKTKQLETGFEDISIFVWPSNKSVTFSLRLRAATDLFSGQIKLLLSSNPVNYCIFLLFMKMNQRKRDKNNNIHTSLAKIIIIMNIWIITLAFKRRINYLTLKCIISKTILQYECCKTMHIDILLLNAYEKLLTIRKK